MKKTHLVSLLTLGLFSVGCVNNDYNFRAYVGNHRLLYDANKLLNEKVIKDNPAISDVDKASYMRRLEAEGKMITDAEALLNGGVLK